LIWNHPKATDQALGTASKAVNGEKRIWKHEFHLAEQ